MSEIVTLPAVVRARIGKGGAREARRNQMIPAVVYGNHQDPQAISVDGKILMMQAGRQGFMNHVIELDIEGQKQRVLPRALQNDPLSGWPIHVDFMRFAAASEIRVAIAVHFANEAQCPGVKLGGVLNVVMHEVEVLARPDAIPEQLIVDLSGLDIGDVVHLASLPLPAGVRLAHADEDATVATIAAPTVSAEPEAAEATTEGETAKA